MDKLEMVIFAIPSKTSIQAFKIEYNFFFFFLVMAVYATNYFYLF